MEHKPQSLKSPQLTSYIVGFLLSIVCTVIVYAVVSRHVTNEDAASGYTFLIGFVLIFALIQLFVQLVFFLHLGREAKPRWNLYALLFTGLIVTILVAGTLWIMVNLDYNMQHKLPEDTSKAIIEDEGITPSTHEHE